MSGGFYRAEFVTIRKDWLYAAEESLNYGIEAMEEELVKHDVSIGRDRPKGKRDAEDMERRIAVAKTNKRLLHDFVYSHSE